MPVKKKKKSILSLLYVLVLSHFITMALQCRIMSIHLDLILVFTWDKKMGGIEPMELQMKAEMKRFKCDQDDEIDH